MQHVHDAADHPTVVDPVRPAATARQQRLDPRPFPIAQPIQLHHPSLPTTGSLNHETASRGIPELSTDPSCLVPGFDGALFSPAWRDALWAKFFMAAPLRQRQSVERYSVVKRA